MATELGKELARRGHSVHFITYEKPFRPPIKSKNIYFHQVKVNEYELFRYPTTLCLWPKKWSKSTKNTAWIFCMSTTLSPMQLRR